MDSFNHKFQVVNQGQLFLEKFSKNDYLLFFLFFKAFW